MTKNDFNKSGICNKKIDEIMRVSIDADNRNAYRIIMHPSNELIKKEDFYPTFILRNKNSIPSEEKQLNRDVEYFGVSLFDTYENVVNFKETVISFRDHDDYCFAKGVVDKNKGTMGIFESNGHFQFFLFDPVGNNPYQDFEYVEKEDE